MPKMTVFSKAMPTFEIKKCVNGCSFVDTHPITFHRSYNEEL